MKSFLHSCINVKDCGALGDGVHLDTAAIQSALDACAGRGGGTVYFPPGSYLSGTLRLRSRVTVQIGAGATLQGSSDPQHFEYIQPKVWSRVDMRPTRAFLYAEDEQQLTLSGEGTIDGGGNSPAFTTNLKDTDNLRPYCLHIVNCRQVTVRDLCLQNSAMWMQRYLQCDEVRLTGLRIHNHATWNNDGMDLDGSSNVVVSDCILDTSDDGICLKSEGRSPSRNITVTNCLISSHASAIKFGTGSIGGFENVVVSNCVVRPSQSKKMVHPLAAWGLEAWGGLAGIDLAATDGGALRHCLFNNIVIQGVETAINVRLGNRLSQSIDFQGYGGQQPPVADGKDAVSPSRIENVTFDNIEAWDIGPYAGVIISGYEGNPVRELTLRNVAVRCLRPSNAAEMQKPISWATNGYPGNRMNNHHLPGYGLMLSHIAGIRLERLRVWPAEGDPRHPHFLREVRDLESLDCRPAVEFSSVQA